jgi:hypothetical protein
MEEGSRMSVPSQAQFAGASGEYYVAAVLAYKRLHVGMVRQGGQSVDLLVSTADGSRSTTIQVKSRGRARKKRKSDGVIIGYDWFIGKKVFDQDPALLYVLVDLKEWAECTPDVFPMRAGELVEHFERLMDARPHKDWENDAYIFQPKPEQIERYRNNWSPLWDDLGRPHDGSG